MFAFNTDQGVFYEDDIERVVIRRGKSGRGGGLHPSTMEVTVRGLLSPTIAGTNARFFIREVPAERIAAHLGGNFSGPTIAMRCTGRAGTLDVEDRGLSFSTTVATASWTARMLRRVSRVTVPMPNQSPADVIMDAVGVTDPNPPAGLSFSSHGPFDLVATEQPAINFRDAVVKFGSDIGVCLLETREGATKVASLPYRAADASTKGLTWLPLVRSQAIAPGQWQQVNDAPAIKFQYRIKNATSGNTVVRTIEVQNWDPTYETVEVDWSYLKSDSSGTSGQSYQEGYGRVYESSTRSYTLPSITVDLIYLMGSDKSYHRQVASQLLAMESGDPVFLSGDWPTLLQGVHFAEGITESITPDSWTLELSLVPRSYVLGSGFKPEIKPRVWESASNRWSEDTRKWNEF